MCRGSQISYRSPKSLVTSKARIESHLPKIEAHLREVAYEVYT